MIFLVLLLAAAVFFDFTKGKIPNLLVIGGGVLALILQFYLGGIAGVFRAVLGMLLPCLVLYVLFSIGVLGAGDIKLLAMTGAFLGTYRTLLCMALAFIVGAVISLVKMCHNGNYVGRMQCFAAYVQEVIRSGKWKLYDSGESMKNRIHFSLPILIGAVILWITVG